MKWIIEIERNEINYTITWNEMDNRNRKKRNKLHDNLKRGFLCTKVDMNQDISTIQYEL